MNPNGNGLGLSICKKIAICFKGDLTCVSTIGHGTTFELTIPAPFEEQALVAPGTLFSADDL
jgi:signal transduction histidine kinase